MNQRRTNPWIRVTNPIKPVVYGVLIIALCLLPLFVHSRFYMHIFILTLVYIVAAVSLRAVIISGQFPLAHAAYMGIGAYVAGLTSRWLGWQPWLTIPLGALVTMAFGMLIGYPFARLRALYYAMASLFFGIGILQVIYAFGKWTGSYSGLSSVDPLFRDLVLRCGPTISFWP